MGLQLMAYDFDLQHISGKAIPHVDVLSRFATTEENDTIFNIPNDEEIPFADNSILEEIRAYMVKRMPPTST